LAEEAPQTPAANTWRLSRPSMFMGILVGTITIGCIATLAAKNSFGAPVAAAAQDSVVKTSYVALQTCYGYTGGGCRMSNCDAARGSQCQAGKCVCVAGCTGADGICHAGSSNELVAEGFTLTNMKWSKYSMYFQGASAFGQLKTTNAFSWLNMGKDKFTLQKMPGNATTTRYFVGSINYPSEVAYIGSTAGTAISGHGLYAADLEDGKSPEKLSCSVCYKQSKNAIMIGNKDGTYWAYIHHASWLVYGSSSSKDNVGDGGYWVPTPAFTNAQIAMLPAC